METKEIDAWVRYFDDGTIMDISTKEGAYYERAKLIIEIPEKKIEITERQFREHYIRHFGQVGDFESPTYANFRDSLFK